DAPVSAISRSAPGAWRGARPPAGCDRSARRIRPGREPHRFGALGDHRADDDSPSLMHADPVAALVARLGVILLAAKLGGEIATRLKQPAVLGEVLAGIALANLTFGGAATFRAIGFDGTIQAIAGIGALILLFEVGLEVTVTQLRQV